MSNTERYTDNVRILMRGNRDLPAGRFPYEVLAPHQREYRASWHEEEWRSGQVHIGNPHNSVNKIPVTLHETEEKGFLHYRLSGGALGSNAIEMMFEPEDKPGYFTTFYDGYVSSEIFFSVDSPFRISRFDVVLDGAQYTFVGSPRDALLVTEHRTLLWGCEAKRTIVLVAPGMGQFYALKPDNIAKAGNINTPCTAKATCASNRTICTPPSNSCSTRSMT